MSEAENVVPTAEATNTIEAPAVEEKVSSGKLLDLAKKEAALVKKEVEYKNSLAEMQNKLKSYEEQVDYFSKAKQYAKDNPEELLGKLGISYDELTENILKYYDNKEKNVKPPSKEDIAKQVEEEINRREAERQNTQAANVLASFGKEITDFVNANESKYPHITKLYEPLAGSNSPEELIFEVIQNYFEETGEVLDLESAAASAEEYFRDEWNKLNGKLSGQPLPAETGKEVRTAPQTANVSDKIVEEPVSNRKFKVSTEQLPTITNNLRIARVPYRVPEEISKREDAIARGVKAYEEAYSRRRG